MDVWITVTLKTAVFAARILGTDGGLVAHRCRVWDGKQYWTDAPVSHRRVSPDFLNYFKKHPTIVPEAKGGFFPLDGPPRCCQFS